MNDGLSEAPFRKKGAAVTEDPSGFDVTCVIGRVEDDPNGTVTRHEAAYLLIARHDTPGTFTWKQPRGGPQVRVTVEYVED